MALEVLPLAMAAVAGVIMAIQGSMNSALGKVVGVWEATFIVHLIGLLFVVIVLFLFRVGSGNLSDFTQAPWYVYFGGILGVLIIYGVAMTMPKIGVAPATTAIIFGQVITASLVDHFGLFGLEKIPFSYWTLLGTLLMAGGAWMLLKN